MARSGLATTVLAVPSAAVPGTTIASTSAPRAALGTSPIRATPGSASALAERFLHPESHPL